MKKFNELLKEIEAASNERRKAEEAYKQADKNIRAIVTAAGFGARKNEEIRAKIEKEEAAEINAATREKDLLLKIAYLKNNARIALYAEALPAVLEIWNKYAGKPYGEKTRAKIRDEIKAAAGIGFYTKSGYGFDTFNIYALDKNGYTLHSYEVEAGAKNLNDGGAHFLKNNKIQKIESDQMRIYYIKNEYIEDIPGRIAELKKAYAEATEAERIYKNACATFNALTADGIQDINTREGVKNWII